MTVAALEQRQTASATSTDWHFLSHVVIRRAGFPFDWLDRLTNPNAAALIADLIAASESLEADADHLLHHAFPAAVTAAQHAGNAHRLRALSKLRARIGRRHTLDLDRFGGLLPAELVARLEQFAELQRRVSRMRAAAATTLDVELHQARGELRALVENDDLQSALFLSNPDLYSSSLLRLLARPAEHANTAFERKLLAYLQRLCAKNDTASFFGPLNCGRIEPRQAAPLVVETQPGKYSRRDVFIGFWVANRLAQLMSADPELFPYLTPRRNPMCRLEPAGAYFPSRNVRARLDAAQLQLLGVIDGQRTVAELAQATGARLDRTEELVRQLVAARILVCRLEIPSTIFHPFTYLLRTVEALPDAWPGKERWLAALQHFELLRQDFLNGDLARRQRALADMDEWYAATTAEPPRRSAGATYADRSLVYEDCAGTFTRFQFSQPFFDDLQHRLAPMLDLCAAHGSLLWRFYQRLGRAVFDDLSPDGRPMPYARFIDEVRRRPAVDPATDPALGQLYAELARRVASASDGRVARLAAADLADVLRDVPIVQNCHLSPDIMLAAPDLDHVRRGDYQVVLGEIHQVFYAWGSQLYFWPERSAAEAEMAAHVASMAEYRGIATVLNERQHKGLLHETFPGTIVEVSALASEQARARVPLSALEVLVHDEQLVLRNMDSGEMLRLYTAGDEQLHLWSLALPRTMPVPIRFGLHTPRVEIGSVVYQRERWQLPASEWGSALGDLAPLDLLERVARVRMRHGLPRRVFVLAPNEPKPYCIDLDSALSLRLLQPLVDSNPHLVLSEMIPDPDQLWLRDQDGAYCCEFRMTACRY